MTIDGTNILQLVTVFQRIIAFLLGIAGGVAIIVIIVGAIRYILSSGDIKAIQSARNAISFGIIGLVIIILAISLIAIIGAILGASNPLDIFNITIQ